MAKLSSIKPRLGGLSTRLSAAPKDEAERTAQRLAVHAYRAWYATKRWRDLRKAVIERDRYICQRTGVLLIGKHPAPNSPVVDHIIRHGGNPELFWDPANLQTISKTEHDKAKQSEDARSGQIKGVWY